MSEKSWPNYPGGHHRLAGLYDLKKTLGRGHFAVVRLAQHVFTGENVAIKVIDKTKLDQTSMDHLHHEVTCMKLVQHPNVVRLYEVIETSSKLYLILELGDGGDMYDYIMRHDQGLEDAQAKEYFAQILSAISYCHKMHVVHRDLKPENVVFFESRGLVKLTDFGFSNRYDPGKKLSTSCGSLAYSAPEILLGEEYDAPAVDVWSLGVILYMLVCGEAPFNEANDSETLTNIMDCKYRVMDHVNRDCRDLIRSMIIREPSERVKLEDIRNHVWLKDCATLKDDSFNSTPVLTRDLISDELHTDIIDKMVQGKLAEHDEIQEAIDADKYNHITSTYFLLAHRRLEAQNAFDIKMETETSHDGKTMPMNVQSGSNNVFLPQNADTLPMPKTVGMVYGSSPPCQQFMLTPSYHPSLHSSIASESDAAEDSSPSSSNSSLYHPGHLHHHKGDKKMSPPFPREHLTITPRHGFSVAKGGIDTLIEEEERSRSQTTTDDEDDNAIGNQEDEDITSARIINPVQLASHLQRASLQKRLKKRKSAPVLNEICEENETENDLGIISEQRRPDEKHLHRRRHAASVSIVMERRYQQAQIDSEMAESDVFGAEGAHSSEDTVPELKMDAAVNFAARTGRPLRRSHKSSGSETSDDDSESRRTSRSSLNAVVLSTINRHRRDSSGDRDEGGAGGGGRGWGSRRNSGSGGFGGSEYAGNELAESEEASYENTSGGKQERMEESQLLMDNNNFNNSSCAEIVNEKVFFRCITPNILFPADVQAERALNNYRGRGVAKKQPVHCNHICNMLEKRSKSAESDQSLKSTYNSSQTSSARSSSSSLSMGNRRGRIFAGHRVRKNSRSTMSDTGLVLRWNNLRRRGIPNSSSSSSSVVSLAVTVGSSTSSRLLCGSPNPLHRPHSEGNVTEGRTTRSGLITRAHKRQSRSTSLPRPCRYVRNNLNNARAASCEPYISHGPSRKRQCLPAMATPGVSIQPCIPESQMATIEPGLDCPLQRYCFVSEGKESNVKRSNISLASSTCSASKYAVDPVNELILSPTEEIDGLSDGSLGRHGNNVKSCKIQKRKSNSASCESIQSYKQLSKYIEENDPPTPTKSGRMKMALLSYISAENIFRRRNGSKSSPVGSYRTRKWTLEHSTSNHKLSSLPGTSSYRVLSSDSFTPGGSLVMKKTKPDCCIIM